MDSIIVRDEYGQPWKLTPEDEELWPKAQEGATYFPMSELVKHRGWGWWSAFKTQQEWLAQSGIPVPGHNLIPTDPAQLRPALQEFGSYVSWLEAQIGLIEGRKNALKQAYDVAVLVDSAGVKDNTKASEKSKEAQILAKSETLRATKRLQIENETLLYTARGLCAAYQRAWETVSRLITLQVSETELSRLGRT